VQDLTRVVGLRSFLVCIHLNVPSPVVVDDVDILRALLVQRKITRTVIDRMLKKPFSRLESLQPVRGR